MKKAGGCDSSIMVHTPLGLWQSSIAADMMTGSTRQVLETAMKNVRWLALLAVVALLGCGPKPPVRIGFIGGLSDRGADVGEGGRNGLILAAEQRNQEGGINGRKVELVVQDDGQSKDKAVAGLKALMADKVDAVVGPFTSVIASAIVPVATEAKVLLISPTVTGADFVGKDDYFYRINNSVFDNARGYAKAMLARGQRKVAVAYDTRNLAFSATWLKAYREAFMELGGQSVTDVPFESQADTAFSDVIRSLVKAKPDALMFVATAVDTARLAQQAVKLAPGIAMATSEWASTETLLELGGQSVEGMLVAQTYNRDDTSARFTRFRDAYQQRFGKLPGYSAVNGYEAATVLLQAISRQTGNESVKEALGKYGPYEGLQQQLVFDQFGDTKRNVYFTEIQAGKFVLLKP